MPSPPRFPWLALPLAALGGAATAFADGAFHARSFSPLVTGQAGLAAACGALTFGLTSPLLAPPPAQEEWMSARPSPARIVLVILAAGLLAGSAAGLLGASGEALSGPLVGLLAALPLLPAALLLVASARRASRARPASIIARAEARAQLSLVAATLGALTALALPAWIAAASDAPPPNDLLLVTLAAALGVAALLLVDLLAARRVERLARQILDHDLPPAADAPTHGRVDFGTGDQASAQVAPRTTYRGGGRTLALVLGDPAGARAALRRSKIQGALALALLELIGVAHGLARDPQGAAGYHTELCDAGVRGSCRKAALLSERAGLPLAEAGRLHALACEAGSDESCLAFELVQRRVASLR
jgi:hypothetical protein